MKLKVLMLSSLLGAGAVLLKENRHSLLKTISDTSEEIQATQHHLTQIKQHLTTIQNQKQLLTELSQDLNYNYRVFSKEVQAHLSEIKSITDKYAKKD